MTIRRVLAIALSAGLLLTVIGLPEFSVYAQDTEGVGLDPGGRSGRDTGSADLATHELSDGQEPAPVDLMGCWTSGSDFFKFDLNEKGTRIERSSTYQFPTNLHGGPSGGGGTLRGWVGSNEFKFWGHGGWFNGIELFFSGCAISGTGKGDASQLEITFKYHEDCRSVLGKERISLLLVPAACP